MLLSWYVRLRSRLSEEVGQTTAEYALVTVRRTRIAELESKGDRRARHVAAPPEACFAVIARLGGRDGWLACTWLWRLRGFLDLLVGGVGMRRGRPEHRALVVGDALEVAGDGKELQKIVEPVR